MQWIYVQDKKIWDLMDGSSVAARLILKEKTEQPNAYLVKTLIASVYTAGKVFHRLTRRKKSWKSSNRKFKTAEQRDRYIEVKKQAVRSYLENYK